MSDFYKLKSGGYLDVVQDEWPINPRGNRGGFGKMYSFHPSLSVDDNPYMNIAELTEAYGVETTGSLKGDLKALHEANPDKAFFPLSLYEHGGQAVFVGEPWSATDGIWDASLIGIAIVTSEDMKSIFLDPDVQSEKGRENAKDILKGELYEFNAYLNGNMYIADFYDKDGILQDDMSVGGFVGDDPYTNGMSKYLSSGDEIMEHLGPDFDIEAKANEIEVQALRKRVAELEKILALKEKHNEKSAPKTEKKKTLTRAE